jgi:hypothetical protein
MRPLFGLAVRRAGPDGWALITELADHLIEGVDFGRIAVINRGELPNWGL